MFIVEMFEGAGRRVVVTYPGRFQPFHLGHADVFQDLQSQFGGDNVYIVTSNKTEPTKSPFSFSDKLKFMHAAGVPDHSIIQTSGRPYDLPDVFQTQKDNIIFIVAVGAPDAARLNPGSIKKDGSPSYFQKMPDNFNDAVTADQHGYVIVVPEKAKTISVGGKTVDVSHGTACRELWNQIRNNPEQRAEFLTQTFGQDSQELGHIMDKISTGAPEPAPKPSPKLKKVKEPKPVDEGVVLTKDQLMDIYLSGRGKFPGSADIRRKVATGVPLEKVDVYINHVAKKFKLNPKAFVYGPPRMDESQAMLTEAMLREAFLDSVVKFLGNKAREIPQQINNLASSLQLLYGVVSDAQRLKVASMLLQRELNTTLASMPNNIRIVVRLKEFLYSMTPKGVTLKDFFTLLLLVGVARTGLVIGQQIKDIRNEALLDPIIEAVQQVPQFAAMIATQGSNAIGSALQALKIGNTLWFELLNKIKASVDWAATTVGLAKTNILTKFPKANPPAQQQQQPPAPAPVMAEEAAGVGVVKNGKDPRYMTATMGDDNKVTAATLPQMMKNYNLVPGKKKTIEGARERMNRQHQQIRKKSGLPDPSYYKELKRVYDQDLPDSDHAAAIAVVKQKYNIKEDASAGATGAGAIATSMGGGAGFGQSIFYARTPRSKKSRKLK